MVGIIMLIVLIVLIALVIAVNRDKLFSGGNEIIAKIPFADINQRIPRMIDTESGGAKFLGDLYVPPASNKQVYQLLKYGGVNYYAKLVRLFGRSVPGNTTLDKVFFVNKLLNKSDSEIIKAIAPTMPQENKDDRARTYAIRIRYNVDKVVPDFTAKRYLDFGCGDGSISKAVAEEFEATEVQGVDVEIPNAQVPLRVIDPMKFEPLPFPKGHFNLITCSMSLHHVRYLSQMMDELVRVLAPGGLIVLREHNCVGAFDAMMIDLEHRLLNAAYNPGGVANNEYIVHATADYWIDEFTQRGIKCELFDYFYTLKYFHEITPTKTCIMVFQK